MSADADNDLERLPRAPRDRPDRATAAGKILVLGGFGLLLYVAHAAFVPIALALLFALILSSPVEALHRLHVPRSLSAAMILILTLGLMGGGLDLLWKPAEHWFASAPETLQTIRQRITPLARF